MAKKRRFSLERAGTMRGFRTGRPSRSRTRCESIRMASRLTSRCIGNTTRSSGERTGGTVLWCIGPTVEAAALSSTTGWYVRAVSRCTCGTEAVITVGLNRVRSQLTTSSNYLPCGMNSVTPRELY
ncbi:hypothetical protein AArcS_0333 [Natranaeroarchaeum sulfidigenes]|uniref:Uncharacterized protein n=1 Tax=Natranaeroarchaeum sulfidigenes TaxID=2784880 RepID=A0A897MLS1_9EURY|nr:hypothetical protein AArcS_0333 [Natranaeroarchaeum sulfidigenes]